MDPDQPHDLTDHAARRRRVLAGVLAGAALAVPGVAFAAGDATSSGSTSAPASDPPALTIQEATPDAAPEQGDGRAPCPEDEGSGGGASEGSSEAAPQAPPAQETAL